MLSGRPGSRVTSRMRVKDREQCDAVPGSFFCFHFLIVTVFTVRKYPDQILFYINLYEDNFLLSYVRAADGKLRCFYAQKKTMDFAPIAILFIMCYVLRENVPNVKAATRKSSAEGTL